eukprot:289257_1
MGNLPEIQLVTDDINIIEGELNESKTQWNADATKLGDDIKTIQKLLNEYNQNPDDDIQPIKKLHSKITKGWSAIRSQFKLKDMDMITGKTNATIVKICSALKRYYDSVGAKYDQQFSKWCKYNELYDNDVIAELEKDSNLCSLVEFDEEFPVEAKYKTNKNARNSLIWNTIQKCYNNPQIIFQRKIEKQIGRHKKVQKRNIESMDNDEDNEDVKDDYIAAIDEVSPLISTLTISENDDKCSKCGLYRWQFSADKYFDTHKLKAHPNQCSKCKLWFVKLTKQHRNTCDGAISIKDPPTCPKCTISRAEFTTNRNFNTHTKAKHDCKCEGCDVLFTNQLVENHKKVCIGDFPDVCPGCGWKYTDFNNGKTSRTPKHWRVHLKAPHNIECPECGRCFTTKQWTNHYNQCFDIPENHLMCSICHKVKKQISNSQKYNHCWDCQRKKNRDRCEHGYSNVYICRECNIGNYYCKHNIRRYFCTVTGCGGGGLCRYDDNNEKCSGYRCKRIKGGCDFCLFHYCIVNNLEYGDCSLDREFFFTQKCIVENIREICDRIEGWVLITCKVNRQVRIGKGASKYKIDLQLVFHSVEYPSKYRIVFIEIDEDCHKGYGKHIELAREGNVNNEAEIAYGDDVERQWNRLNPNGYDDNDSAFKYNGSHWKPLQSAYNRANVLIETIIYQMNNGFMSSDGVSKNMNKCFLYYQKFDEQLWLDKIDYDKNNNIVI